MRRHLPLAVLVVTSLASATPSSGALIFFDDRAAFDAATLVVRSSTSRVLHPPWVP